MTVEENGYALGHQEPNYKVPAIPMYVFIDIDYIEICILDYATNHNILCWHASWYFDGATHAVW